MKISPATGFADSPVSFVLPVVFALLISAGCTSSRPPQDSEEQPANETVDVGYGSIDKDHLVGSVSTVDAEDAQVVQATTLADMLRGRAAGVQVTEVPGGGIRVRIRGSRSFNGGNDPLYVVDDMVIQAPDGTLYGINPHDIESISVLKDASATSIYGSRGSNGVILIRTKRGLKP